MQGCHKRFEIAKCLWEGNEFDPYAQEQAAMAICIVIAGYYGGLQGEEIGKVDKGSMLKHWDESIKHRNSPFVPLILVGRFKRVTGEKMFCQPLVAKTNNGRRLDIWFARLLSLSKTSGNVQGSLFPNKKGKGMTITELDVFFHGLLKEVQHQNPLVIPNGVNIGEVYSTYQSLRWGATLEAQNVNISEEVINTNNRWRKESCLKGVKPKFNMIEVYSDAHVLAPTLIRFLKELPS